jgi:hypothetical protein
MRFRVVAVLTALCALALPAVASAKPAKKADRATTVRTHVRAADRALRTGAALVRRNHDAKAMRYFARGRAELRAAKGSTRILKRGATRGARASRTADATLLTAREDDQTVDLLSGLLDDVSGADQAQLAGILSASLIDRDALLAQLGDLIALLPAEDQATISAAIASLSAGGSDLVTTLSGLLDGGTGDPAATAALNAALDSAVASLSSSVALLTALIPDLPADLQPAIQSALTDASAGVDEITALLQGLIDGLPAAGDPSGGDGSTPSGDDGSTDGPTDGSAGTDGLPSVDDLTALLNDLLGGLTLPGLDGG